MALRLDETGFGDIKLWQDKEGFCYGVDAVLLADFAARSISERHRRCEKIADLGTGNGIIPLVLSHKTGIPEIWGIEVQRASYELALKNADLNGLSGRVRFVLDDVRRIAAEGFADGDKNYAGHFDAVTANPPYTKPAGGIPSGTEAVRIARHEVLADLDDFIGAAALLLRDKGDFYMVHRPSRLVDICDACRHVNLEPKELRFVSGKPMEKANILLIHCVKNGNRELSVLKPLSVRTADGDYSEEMLCIYERTNRK